MKIKQIMFAILCVSIAVNVHGQENAGSEKSAEKKPAAAKKEATSKPVKITENSATLTPENSRVDFVGTHVGDDPKPRYGGFAKFNGRLDFSQDGKTLTGMKMDFQTDSVWTEMGGLTTHLKQADFFNIEKFSEASFQSSEIKDQGDGVYNVKGNLTLLGNAKEVSFVARSKMSDAGILLGSQFVIDRTLFGMDQNTKGVESKVAVSLSIGDKTTGKRLAVSGAARDGQRRGPGGTRMDPMEFFKQMDGNSDGKLEGDEIPEQMKRAVEMMDTDKDGAISMDEFKTVVESRGGRRGGRGGRGERKKGGGKKRGSNRPGSDG